jgi:ABC-type antimicrobial peptide transport system permease subunit
MVLGQLGRMLLAGSLAGLLAAFAPGRVAQSLLYGLKGSDPGVLIGAVFVLTIVAVAAGWIPAYRASRVEPMQALRYE